MTTFARRDSVARVFDERPEVLDRLAEGYPELGCFTSRKVADEVTLEEAAHMAEVAPDSLVAYVNGTADTLRPEGAEDVTARSAPDWAGPVLSGTQEAAVFDARAAIASGRDPKQEIVEVAGRLSEGGVFVVEAPFDPVPLRNLLGQAGFDDYGYKAGPGRWRVLFRRRQGRGAIDVASLDIRVASRLRQPQVEDEAVLDLRRLEPPVPLVTILRRIESGEGGGRPFVVRLERDPVFLYPELDDRGWSWEVLQAGADEVRLRLFKAGGDDAA